MGNFLPGMMVIMTCAVFGIVFDGFFVVVLIVGVALVVVLSIVESVHQLRVLHSREQMLGRKRPRITVRFFGHPKVQNKQSVAVGFQHARAGRW